MNKLKPITKKEHEDLAAKVENEGFGYYMLDYGPDLTLIERMGFDRKKLDEALVLLGQVKDAIDDCEQYANADGEEE